MSFFAGSMALGLSFFAKHIPWSIEKRLSTSLKLISKSEICNGSAPQNSEPQFLFNRITQRIYPLYPIDKTFPLTVEVIHGPTVNAFASLGGHVYIYEGLITQADSAEELAGILAHEIEHVRRHHIMQGVFARLLTFGSLRIIFSGTDDVDPQLLGVILNMKFSREQEREADEGGLKRLYDAHVDVSGLKNFFERAQNMASLPSILSDHPSDKNRALLTQQYARRSTQPILTYKEWTRVKGICNHP